jgi:hypothetical protein
MDEAEKMNCRAKGEVILWAMSPLLPQSPKISDSISQRIELTGRRKGLRYHNYSSQEQRIVLTGK